MTDDPIALDNHRGTAAQRATDIRRRSGKVAADQAELRRRQEELEHFLPAAPRRDIPSRSTAFTTRSRRSLEYDLPIHAGLLSSQHLESENIPSRESPTTQNQLIPL